MIDSAFAAIEAAVLATFSGSSSPALLFMLTAASILAAATQYSATAISGIGPYGWRVCSALGWTMLVLRFGYGYILNVPPTLPPGAAFALLLLAAGAVLRNIADSSCLRIKKCQRTEDMP